MRNHLHTLYTRAHWRAFGKTLVLLMSVGILMILGGCAGIGATTPSVTSTPTSTPTPLIIEDPNVDCDTAAQLIRQKDVSEVKIYYDNTGAVTSILVVVIHDTQVYGRPISAG